MVSLRRVKPRLQQRLHQVREVRPIIPKAQPLCRSLDALNLKQDGLLLPSCSVALAPRRFRLQRQCDPIRGLRFIDGGKRAAAYFPDFSAIDDLPYRPFICQPCAPGVGVALNFAGRDSFGGGLPVADDADLLLKAGRCASAKALAIMAIEEAGKYTSILSDDLPGKKTKLHLHRQEAIGRCFRSAAMFEACAREMPVFLDELKLRSPDNFAAAESMTNENALPSPWMHYNLIHPLIWITFCGVFWVMIFPSSFSS